MPLTHYAYDPLDRLRTTAVGAQPATQRFYNHERLSTIRQGEHSQTVFQHHDQLLAEKHTSETLLLGTDQQHSVLHSLSGSHKHLCVYSPYGHHRVQSEQQSLLGFNGEAPDPITGHYLLGNGHRGYNPVLMRFNSPDTLSPFGAGGVNPYSYCLGDPVNRVDPNGQFSISILAPAVLAIAGLAGTINGAIPAVGFYASFKAVKAGTAQTVHYMKVAGVGLTAAAGVVGATRLSMAAGGEESGSTEMTIAGLALAFLGLGSSIAATKVGWKSIRAAAKKNKIKTPLPMPPTDLSPSFSPRNSISSTQNSGSYRTSPQVVRPASPTPSAPDLENLQRDTITRLNKQIFALQFPTLSARSIRRQSL